MAFGEDDDDDDVPQPVFQSGGDQSAEAKEADRETARGGGLEPGRGGGAPSTAAAGRPAAKAVIVGDSGIGKSSLLVRFCQDMFKDTTKATVGVDMLTREVPLADGTSTLSMQLWDTAGQEQFHALTASYFRDAHAVILAYDVHQPQTLSSLERWIGDVDRYAPAEVCKIVVGTKWDGSGVMGTAVAPADAEAFAEKHGALHERCSARDGNGVFQVFERLADKVVRAGFDPDSGKGGGLHVGGGAKKKKGCC